MRTKTDWRSCSKDNYNNFCNRHSLIKLSFDEWKIVVYGFNEAFKEYLLETGEKAKLPHGFGEFGINKKIRKKIVNVDGKDYINLPVDWQKSKEKGKRIYNFNYHSEGYFFGWVWFKDVARFKHLYLWYFKASRSTSRLLAHYIKTDEKYQQLYKEWKH